jgi:hypothetical protein
MLYVKGSNNGISVAIEDDNGDINIEINGVLVAYLRETEEGIKLIRMNLSKEDIEQAHVKVARNVSCGRISVV